MKRDNCQVDCYNKRCCDGRICIAHKNYVTVSAHDYLDSSKNVSETFKMSRIHEFTPDGRYADLDFATSDPDFKGF